MQASSGASIPGLQPALLPVSSKKKSTTPALHANKGPVGKRPREDTPSPEKATEPTTIEVGSEPDTGSGTDWHGRINEDVKWIKGKIGTAARGLKTDKIVTLAESVREFMNNTLVDIVERQASTNSDLCTEVIWLRKENKRLVKAMEKQKDELSGVKACKDKVEVKASRKEMEDRIKVAVTQVKIPDLEIGKEITDRKELSTAAKDALAAKVRTDLRKEYDDKIRSATIRVVSSKTFKTVREGKTLWTAPVLVTIADKESRWAMENCLRSSKVYPSFHWPREMVDNVKVYRQVVRDMGYSDSTHYIRIRPEERDGLWKIRADAKEKSGNARFVSVASFDIPPFDESLKNSFPGWATPTWTRKPAASAAAAEAGGADGMAVDFAEDVEIQNL
jgi:hypothetical protein